MALYPILIEENGKHTNYRYLARNLKEKKEIGLLILENWKLAGYLYLDKSVPSSFEKYVAKETEGFTLSGLKELAQGSLAKIKIQIKENEASKTPMEHLTQLKRRFDLLNEHNHNVKLALDSLKKKDGTSVWEVIDYFSDAEYMRVKTVVFDNINY